MFLDFIYVVLCIIIAIQFPKILLAHNEQQYRRILVQLALFHFLLGIAFYFTTTNGGGDAWGYWVSANKMNFSDFVLNLKEGEGTAFMRALNYIPASVLKMSFFANTMFYSMLGFFGISYFFMIAIRTIPYNKILFGYIIFPLILFMPNLHFWSAGVGKDTILFLCIAMFAYGVLSPFKRIPLLVISIVVSLAIRPHITLFLFVGFGLAYIVGGKISVFHRVAFSTLLLGIGIAILPSVLQFAKIDEASAAGFDKFAQAKSSVLSRASTGSAIDVSAYPFPLKVLTFLFRPFFFDVRNFNGLVASIENLILVIVFIKAMMLKPFQAFRAAPFVIKGLVFFLIIGTLAFSQSLGNVGIMIRMRNMFLPGMLIFILWIFSYDQQKRLKRKL